MTSSDSFDDDDFLAGIDLAELDGYEAQAFSATQAGKPPALPNDSRRSHHTVPAVHADQVKEPRPINTEPRAGGQSTFGFGEGGKHGHPANQARYIDNVQKRKEYWGIRRDDDEEADVPTVTIDDAGRYGLLAEPLDEDDEGVVDLHAPGGGSSAYARRRMLANAAPSSSQGALARRLAIAQATRDMSGVVAHTDSLHSIRAKSVHDGRVDLPSGSNLIAKPARVLSRSVSVGDHILASTSRQGAGSNTIPSQSSQGPVPASQGTLLRRSVLELDEEKRRTVELEAKIETLSRELTMAKTQQQGKHAHWADGLTDRPRDHASEDHLKKLQSDLWRAKGEAETMRRNQREDTHRHLVEVDRLRQRIGEMEKAVAEREKENAAHIESVKSQAIFATHAAFNSTGKARARAGSTLRPVTPNASQSGSPQRRQGGQAMPDSKRTVHQQSPSKNGGLTPKFGGLHNAFSTDIRIRRASPRKSDLRGHRTDKTLGEHVGEIRDRELNPASRMDDVYDGRGADDLMSSSQPDEATTEGPMENVPGIYEQDRRTAFLHHLLNHITPAHDATRLCSQPDIYLILQYQPTSGKEEYRECCSDFLRGCAELEAALAEVATIMVTALSRAYAIIAQSALDLDSGSDAPVLQSIIGLLASTCLLFGDQVSLANRQSLATTSRHVLDRHLRERAKHGDKTTKINSPSRSTTISQRVVRRELLNLCQALCWNVDICVWTGEDLALIISTLAHPREDPATVLQSIELFRVAACNPRNFRALVATAASVAVSDHDQSPLLLPVVETMCRYFVSTHPMWAPQNAALAQMAILRALTMLCCAGHDAVVLVGERSSIIPAIIVLLGRRTEKLLGFSLGKELDQLEATNTIAVALFLLHHIVYPVPDLPRSNPGLPIGSLSQQVRDRISGHPIVARSNDAQSTQGVDLQARVLAASAAKEWTGLQHIFVRAMGSLAYCEPLDIPAMFKGPSLAEPTEAASSQSVLRWRTIQYLSQDLLESVVEGPEADEIYEMYFNGSETLLEGGATDDMDVDGGADEDEYAAMRDAMLVE